MVEPGCGIDILTSSAELLGDPAVLKNTLP